MPYVIRPPRPTALIFALVCAALLASIALPAAASATAERDGCPATPTTKVFERFGDNADYSLVPGGRFESGTSDWSLTEAAVVRGHSGDEEHGAADNTSLSIQPDGEAVSPEFCAGIEYPTFRFMARQTSGKGKLKVSLRWTNDNGKTKEKKVGELRGERFDSWQPSPVLELCSALPDGLAKKTVDVSLVFESGGGGTWAIDDVYVDPFRR